MATSEVIMLNGKPLPFTGLTIRAKFEGEGGHKGFCALRPVGAVTLKDADGATIGHDVEYRLWVPCPDGQALRDVFHVIYAGGKYELPELFEADQTQTPELDAKLWVNPYRVKYVANFAGKPEGLPLTGKGGKENGKVVLSYGIVDSEDKARKVAFAGGVTLAIRGRQEYGKPEAKAGGQLLFEGEAVTEGEDIMGKPVGEGKPA
jgi:hypothetical protein